MKFAELHHWDVTPDEARAIQSELAGRVELTRREWMQVGVAAAFPAGAGPDEDPWAALADAAQRAAGTWARQ